MGTKNKNIKNSLGAKWNASHLAVRLCALRHWKRVSMPPTTQSLRHPLTRAFHFAPRIKTARRFMAKNPWWYNDFLEGGCIKFPQTILHGRDAIIRAGVKWLIFNIVSLLWADVKYHVPTGFFAEGERFLSFWRCHRPRKRAVLVMWCGWFKPLLEIRHATALTTGAKHWHR